MTVLNKSKTNFIIVGDMNINLMKFNIVTNVTDYVNTITSSGCNLFIDKPTRITDHSATCIDHVYSNFAADRLENFVLLSDVSDHFSTLTKIDRFQKRNAHVDVYTRNCNLSESQWDQFRADLREMLIHKCVNLKENPENTIKCDNSDIDTYANNMTCSYDIPIEKHMPERKLSRKEKKFNERPWITKGLRISIAKKNELYKQSKLDPLKIAAYKR